METHKAMNFKELDRVFSLWIRQRDMDEYGRVQCCTCDTVSHWSEMDCGHWQLRDNKGTRVDERNCHSQCKICNRHKDGMYDEHSTYIINRHGSQALADLVYNARHEKHWMQFEINELVKEYKLKLKSIP